MFPSLFPLVPCPSSSLFCGVIFPTLDRAMSKPVLQVSFRPSHHPHPLISPKSSTSNIPKVIIHLARAPIGAALVLLLLVHLHARLLPARPLERRRLLDHVDAHLLQLGAGRDRVGSASPGRLGVRVDQVDGAVGRVQNAAVVVGHRSSGRNALVDDEVHDQLGGVCLLWGGAGGCCLWPGAPGGGLR